MQTLDNFMENHQLFLDYLRMFQRMTVDKIIKVEYVGSDKYHVWYEDKERAKKENLDNSFRYTVFQLDLNQFFYYQIVRGRQFENEYNQWRSDRKLRTMSEKFSEYLKSDESKVYFEDLKVKEELNKSRVKKAHELFESGKLDFDSVMQRLIKEHDDAYHEKCFKKGYEPYPNEKLELLFSVASRYGKEVNAEDTKEWCETPFSTSINLYRNHYFVHMYGQGTASFVLNLQEDRLINL